MPIKDFYKPGRPVISFEVFPPKKDDDAESIVAPLSQMSALCPDFISVTCGAGGSGNTGRTAQVASLICRQGITALAHLTCMGADRARILQTLRQLHSEGIRDILALRGDPPTLRLPPSGGSPDDPPGVSPDPTGSSSDDPPGRPPSPYRFAEDLIREIRCQGDFCIGAACYPEGHIDCDDPVRDIARLRKKQEAGADFLITQLFFDNDIFFRFLDRARGSGVTLPVSAGVMPILGRTQIERMIFMCGASLPSAIIRLLHKYEHSPGALRRAGIEHAAVQIAGLLDQGVDGVHIYTMNRPEIAEYCMKSIGRIK